MRIGPCFAQVRPLDWLIAGVKNLKCSTPNMKNRYIVGQLASRNLCLHDFYGFLLIF